MKFRFVLTALFVGCSALGLPLTAPAQSIYDAENGRSVPESAAQIQLSFAPLVKETAPAVVNIFTRAEITRSPLGVLGDEFFNSPFGSQSEKVQTALGSGVILTAEGLVVTNDHVIRDGTEIEVELTDGREFNAEVLFTDRAADLALLQIDPGEGSLPSLQLGNSDNVEIGDLVLAIGNPFGVGQTTTMGIVSALARTGTGVTEVGSFIQTDAAINPGNSGGALVDMKGQVIGINTAIFSSSGASAGIGFAIPANFVANTVRALEEGGGTVVRPWLGVTGETVTERMAKVLKLDNRGGFLVDEVYEPSPSFDAGLQTGDVILGLGGTDINDRDEIRYLVAASRVGEELPLQIFRDGDVIELALLMAAPPEVPPRNPTQLVEPSPLEGATVINLSPAASQELDMPGSWTGVVISEAPRGSTASRQGFAVGDVIRSINRETIDTVEDLEEVLAAANSPRWSFLIERGGRAITIRIVYRS